MSVEADLLGAFEEHSPDGIREALSAGASPTEPIKGKRPLDCLIEGYLRSSKFDDCIRVLLDAGASVGDPLLQAVLLDDGEGLRRLLKESNGDIQRKMSPLCAFTSCRGVSALHICAEFNSLRCASVLLDAGADVNARAEVDGNGLGGQTPIFHAVNSIFNYCRPVMELLVERGAVLDLRVKFLLCGESFDWETVIFDVSPISYAQCGLYKQFHRKEGDVYSNIAYLHETRYGSAPTLRNVPNKYLRG
jgi:hypothetical protein